MISRLNVLLTLILLSSALTLVNAQYRARQLFIEQERMATQARQLDVEWAQLQLDQSTLGQNARIQMRATHDLNMVPLTQTRTRYLTLGEK